MPITMKSVTNTEFTSLIKKGSTKTIEWIESKYCKIMKCPCFIKCSRKILEGSILLVHLKNNYEEKIFLCNYTNENTTLCVLEQFREADCHDIKVKVEGGGGAKEILYFKRTQHPVVYMWDEFVIYHLE